MSNKRLTAVWDLSAQKGTKLLTLLSLADRSDDDGYCWPSHEDTAKRARSKRTYIGRLITEIEADGELYVHPRPGKSSKYLVIVGMEPDAIRAAMIKRFNYSAEIAAEKVSVILTCQQNRRVSSTEGSEDDVSEELTPPLSVTEHEPLLSPNESKAEPVKDSAAPPPPPEPDVNTKHELFKALIDVTFYRPGKNGKITGQLNNAAKTLSENGNTPEQVRALFSKGGLWYQLDWRGQKNQPPTPENVADEIDRLMDPDFQDLKATPNGKPGTTFERNAQAAAEVRRKYGIQEDR